MKDRVLLSGPEVHELVRAAKEEERTVQLKAQAALQEQIATKIRFVCLFVFVYVCVLYVHYFCGFVVLCLVAVYLFIFVFFV